MVKPNQHGAGISDYFHYYRSLVEEFENELVFRAFLVEFGRHVTKAYAFDSSRNCHWWTGALYGKTNFYNNGHFSVIDKAGLVDLSHNLASGTYQVLDNFSSLNIHANFLRSVAVEKNVVVLQHLEEIPIGPEEPLEKHQAPTLRPLIMTLGVELQEVQRKEKISKSMLDKRPPDITDKEIKRRDQLKKAQETFKAKKQARQQRIFL